MAGVIVAGPAAVAMMTGNSSVVPPAMMQWFGQLFDFMAAARRRERAGVCCRRQSDQQGGACARGCVVGAFAAAARTAKYGIDRSTPVFTTRCFRAPNNAHASLSGQPQCTNCIRQIGGSAG